LRLINLNNIAIFLISSSQLLTFYNSKFILIKRTFFLIKICFPLNDCFILSSNWIKKSIIKRKSNFYNLSSMALEFVSFLFRMKNRKIQNRNLTKIISWNQIFFRVRPVYCSYFRILIRIEYTNSLMRNYRILSWEHRLNNLFLSRYLHAVLRIVVHHILIFKYVKYFYNLPRVFIIMTELS
jgi:hypothetical protein